MLRSRDTDVEVFGGEVESLAVAEIDGVGRARHRRRTGRATRGRARSTPTWSPRPSPRRATTPASVRPTRATGSRHPADFAGVEAGAVRRSSTCGATTCSPTLDRRQGGARPRARRRRARGRPPRPRAWSRPPTATPRSRPRSRTRSAWRRRRGAPPRRARRSRWRARARATQTGERVLRRAQRSPTSTCTKAAHDAAERAVRLLGARPIPSGRLPVVFDPLVTRSLLALLGGALDRRGDRQGPVDVRRPRG